MANESIHGGKVEFNFYIQNILWLGGCPNSKLIELCIPLNYAGLKKYFYIDYIDSQVLTDMQGCFTIRVHHLSHFW